MYIFEFEHKLTRKDLTDMWQNLPPDIGTSFKANTVSIQHQMLEKEFFKFEDEVPDELRWKVFKVKQRAEKNYFNKIRKSVWHEKRQSFSRYGNTEGSRDHDSIYSYNWPYDFFSLVELVKMETDVSIGSATPLQISPLQPQTTEVILARPGTTTSVTLSSEKFAQSGGKKAIIRAIDTFSRGYSK